MLVSDKLFTLGVFVLGICVSLIVVGEPISWPYYAFEIFAVIAIIASFIWGVIEKDKQRKTHDAIIKAITDGFASLQKGK
jgi:hypothetical protein